MEDGRWQMEDRRWKTEDGRWKMEDGGRKMCLNEQHFYNNYVMMRIRTLRHSEFISESVSNTEMLK